MYTRICKDAYIYSSRTKALPELALPSVCTQGSVPYKEDFMNGSLMIVTINRQNLLCRF